MFSSTGFRTCKISHSISTMLWFFCMLMLFVSDPRNTRCWLMGLRRLWHAMMRVIGVGLRHPSSAAS